ncbi:MAG: hypothetical protein JWO96_90 [Candidatus Saccharibacteria bacterium]|nr:hypothetical protein [Candidatus Saccharibacteria bacterium]
MEIDLNNGWQLQKTSGDVMVYNKQNGQETWTLDFNFKTGGAVVTKGIGGPTVAAHIAGWQASPAGVPGSPAAPAVQIASDGGSKRSKLASLLGRKKDKTTDVYQPMIQPAVLTSTNASSQPAVQANVSGGMPHLTASEAQKLTADITALTTSEHASGQAIQIVSPVQYSPGEPHHPLNPIADAGHGGPINGVDINVPTGFIGTPGALVPEVPQPLPYTPLYPETVSNDVPAPDAVERYMETQHEDLAKIKDQDLMPTTQPTLANAPVASEGLQYTPLSPPVVPTRTEASTMAQVSAATQHQENIANKVNEALTPATSQQAQMDQAVQRAQVSEIKSQDMAAQAPAQIIQNDAMQTATQKFNTAEAKANEPIAIPVHDTSDAVSRYMDNRVTLPPVDAHSAAATGGIANFNPTAAVPPPTPHHGFHLE